MNHLILAILKKSISTSLITNEEVHEQQININKDSQRIPLLENIFKKYPDKSINLDIKINNDELINKVII
jgi:hypothetical protein